MSMVQRTRAESFTTTPTYKSKWGPTIPIFDSTSLNLGNKKPNYTNLRFYLTELGEQKAILGYPWFAVAQPKIDWK